MRRHRSCFTVSGDGAFDEVRLLPGVWFFRRRMTQKWSPLLHEVEQSLGLRFGHVRVGLTSVKKHFFDGKEPAVVRGAF